MARIFDVQPRNNTDGLVAERVLGFGFWVLGFGGISDAQEVGPPHRHSQGPSDPRPENCGHSCFLIPPRKNTDDSVAERVVKSSG